MPRSEATSAETPRQELAGGRGRIAVWAITPNGAVLSGRLCRALCRSYRFLSASLAPEVGEMGRTAGTEGVSCRSFSKLSEAVAEEFGRFSGHVFIMATGIVVRMIAKHLEDKTVDPAVVVVDDRGLHSISLLSGHLGGANALAEEVADILNVATISLPLYSFLRAAASLTACSS